MTTRDVPVRALTISPSSPNLSDPFQTIFKQTQVLINMSAATNTEKSKGTLQIHSENILPIIKKWLYSDKDIFVRELVSNACDALYKIKTLRDHSEATATDEEFRVEIKIDKAARTLSFNDTGLGMTADEVEKYIAQLAFSGAQEFLEKYKSKEEKDQIIGHFGLGFYSAYMVAKKVEIQTLSYKEGAEPAEWICDGSAEYEMGQGTRETRGTEITLFLNEDENEFLEESRIRTILDHYCSFLPYPIYLNGSHINNREPLWMKPVTECTDKDYLDFYQRLYPMEAAPLFWIHLNVDYPFHLKGILYFPKINRDTQLSKNTVKLFCNRVFVSDNCKDVMPQYLTILQGAIDSPDIPLNVSRSYLQMDRTVRQLATHISKKVADKLSALFRTDKEAFLRSWEDIELIIKLGALQDDKFYEQVKSLLVWKNTKGEWTTTEEYLERNREKTKDKIFYTTDPAKESHFLNLYTQQGIEVLCSGSSIDIHFMHLLEEKLRPVSFQRIDGGIDDAILDPSKEQSVLDAEGRTEGARLANLIRSSLAVDKLEVEAKSLASDALPGFIVLDESSRRMRDYMAMSQRGNALPEAMMAVRKTFVVNTNNKLMKSIQTLNEKEPELAKELALQVYELCLLSQKEISRETLDSFIARSHRLLEELATKR